jgi:hypothetical protein
MGTTVARDRCERRAHPAEVVDGDVGIDLVERGGRTGRELIDHFVAIGTSGAPL